MSRISQTVKNLVAGISQQPALLRLPEQLETQVNGFSTEASGLQKRPPTCYIADLGIPFANPEPLVHIANRDEDERYMMILMVQVCLFMTFMGTRRQSSMRGTHSSI